MAKALVAYFSASGVTKKLAENLAVAIGADVFEIVPEQVYTKEDLNWQDPNSRSSVEMKDRACRPAIASRVDAMSQYEVSNRRMMSTYLRIRNGQLNPGC